MSTIGSHNTRNPTVKRIQREALELTKQPSPDFTAFPLETNLFEWHFTLRGPPAPSPFAGGIYHGRIVLPPTYPLRPPSFRFLTPSGRFEVNREICLSISGHHEESWQPAWGIRTALVAIRSFMDTDAKGQLGGVDTNRQVRERFANESRTWKCSCAEGKNNEEVMKAVEEECKQNEAGPKAEDAVPEELKLGYRDELGREKGTSAEAAPTEPGGEKTDTAVASSQAQGDTDRDAVAGLTSPGGAGRTSNTASVAAPAAESQQLQPTPTLPLPQQQQTLRQQPQPNSDETNWLDTAIAGVAAALLIMVIRKVVQYM